MTQQTVIAPPPSAPPAYEFSKTENTTISRTATWAKALSVMFFFSTCVQIINLNVLGILVDLAIAITFWKGANLLDAVVTTQDDDVPNMLGALTQLQTAFTIRIIITAIAAAIGLVVSVGFFIQYGFLEQPVAEPAVTVEDEDAEEDAQEDAQDDAAPADSAEPPAEDAAVPAAADAVPAEGEDAAPADSAAPVEEAAGDTPPD